jgi:hypothetical protein
MNVSLKNSSVSRERPNDTNPCQSEDKFHAFLEELMTFRREMAVINAKLEYIRYMKGRDSKDLSDVEKKRIEMEPVLISRLDVIFELIDVAASAK